MARAWKQHSKIVDLPRWARILQLGERRPWGERTAVPIVGERMSPPIALKPGELLHSELERKYPQTSLQL